MKQKGDRAHSGSRFPHPSLCHTGGLLTSADSCRCCVSGPVAFSRAPGDQQHTRAAALAPQRAVLRAAPAGSAAHPGFLFKANNCSKECTFLEVDLTSIFLVQKTCWIQPILALFSGFSGRLPCCMSRSACSFVCFILANVKRTAAPAEISFPQTLGFIPQLSWAMNPWDRLCDLPAPGAQNIKQHHSFYPALHFFWKDNLTFLCSSLHELLRLPTWWGMGTTGGRTDNPFFFLQLELKTEQGSVWEQREISNLSLLAERHRAPSRLLQQGPEMA